MNCANGFHQSDFVLVIGSVAFTAIFSAICFATIAASLAAAAPFCGVLYLSPYTGFCLNASAACTEPLLPCTESLRTTMEVPGVSIARHTSQSLLQVPHRKNAQSQILFMCP